MQQTDENIVKFEAFLSDAGLSCSKREEPPNSMGYKRIEYTGPAVTIRMILDRGFWNLAISDPKYRPEFWYDVSLLTYLLKGPPNPRMPFGKQMEYVKAHWQEILDAFSANHVNHSHARLDAAKLERANEIYTVWPTAITEFEEFLMEQGLSLIERKKPRFLYDSMTVEYGNSQLAVRMDSKDGWHLDVSDGAHPGQWYTFSTIRRFLQWPDDKKVGFVEMFEFIKSNWPRIVDMFGPQRNRETHEHLRRIGSAMSREEAN